MQLLACAVSLKQTDETKQLALQQLADVRNGMIQKHPQLRHAHANTYNMADRPFLAVSMIGASSTVLLARGDLLRQAPIESKALIQSFHSNLLDKSSQIHDTLKDIAMENSVSFRVECGGKPSMTIRGHVDTVESAKVQTLVALDQQLGMTVATMDMPCYLQHLVAGIRHETVQAIMEDTGVNVYLQSPFYKLSDTRYTSLPIDQRKDTIYLTGTPEGIVRAKDILKKTMEQKKATLFQKDSIIKPFKLDWMLRYRQEEMSKIMKDDGSIVLFPAIGSGCNTITVYAENRVRVERTLRLLNYLQYAIYEVNFAFKVPSHGDEIALKRLFGSYEALGKTLDQIVCQSGVEVLVSGSSQSPRLELIGTHSSVVQACSVIDRLAIKQHINGVQFMIEMASDQREFISGKKNGKINKIMKACDVELYFSAANEYNVAIIVESGSMANALAGLDLLQDELPAETSFYVPEIYHRRIIGVGGKNIQRVMKKYGVYVKFSGAEEYNAMGGYFEKEHNVVARTPMKNKASLYQLEEAIMEFIAPDKDKEFGTCPLSIPFHLHSQLAHQHGVSVGIRDLTRLYGLHVVWPPRNGSDEVLLYGPRAHLPRLAMFLQSKSYTEWLFAVDLRTNEDTDAHQWLHMMQDRLQHHAPLVELAIALSVAPESSSDSGNAPGAVIWTFHPFSSGSTVFRVRYSANHPRHDVCHLLTRLCKEDGRAIEFEGVPREMKGSEWSNSLQRSELMRDGALPPSPKATPPPNPLFDPTWSALSTVPANSANFAVPGGNGGPSSAPAIAKAPTMPLYTAMPSVMVHPFQCDAFHARQTSPPAPLNTNSPSYQPIRTIFESVPIPSPPANASFLAAHHHQHHQHQHQQRHYGHETPLLCQPFTRPPLMVGPQATEPRRRAATPHRWGTPGCPARESSRSSCPDIFLAPDLFAATALRRASVAIPGDGPRRRI